MIKMFDNISPVDYRYNEEGTTKYLSAGAKIKYMLKVECAAAEAMAEIGLCTRDVAKEICDSCSKITPEEVHEEEKKTKHDIRALVNCIRKNVSDKAKPFVHLGLTSYDVVNTSDSMRYMEFTEKILLPSLIELEKTLIEIALREKDTLQIGRTHGQHAEPITFGFAVAEYVDRLGNSILKIRNSSKNLIGKISGAVGSYNSTSLLVDDPEEYEKKVLEKLNLKPGGHSTQITEPENTLDFVHSVISSFGVVANLADDMRHLQRTEIDEIGESFEKSQVGSSTMPHKKNPINFENVKSVWKAMMPRIITLYSDQISEHQRDLTNSASSRFTGEILAIFYSSTKRMSRTMKKVSVEKGRMYRNFEMSKSHVIAEPLYILLAYHGHPDAHEAVRKIATSGRPLLENMKNDPELSKYIGKFTSRHISILNNPEKYTGIASQKTEKLCKHWEKELADLQ
jgi:adenylosuccinate lyase